MGGGGVPPGGPAYYLFSSLAWPQPVRLQQLWLSASRMGLITLLVPRPLLPLGAPASSRPRTFIPVLTPHFQWSLCGDSLLPWVVVAEEGPVGMFSEPECVTAPTRSFACLLGPFCLKCHVAPDAAQRDFPGCQTHTFCTSSPYGAAVYALVWANAD